MSNIIELDSPEVRQAEQELQQRIDQYTAELDRLAQAEKDLKQRKIECAVGESHTIDRSQKKQFQSELRQLEAELKKYKLLIDNQQETLQLAETDMAKLKGAKRQVFSKINSEQTARKVFEMNNIHYVIFDQQWWSVDPTGSRMDVKINRSDSNVIKDLIFDDSRWEIKEEQELKRLAKSMDRMFKHIVRDIGPDRPGVYNQMKDIQKQWLVPVQDVAPHEAFRILCLSISGGSEEYADQIEKFIAYRYCHPDDVLIPNIDSCAIGGTGRDTLWNIVTTIFTNECCGVAGEETFKGTHNGDLFGKMFVKIDEKDSARVPIDKLKELTGSNKYRDRQMQRDARDVVRLFSFFMFRNGYTTTARLAGTGRSGEDRRWEPVIARVNLNRHVAKYYGVIDNINQDLTLEQSQAIEITIKEWQRDVYKNENRIAEWLGNIIQKHSVHTMSELLPLHGVYYDEMLDRQKRGIDGFMPKFMRLFAAGDSTVISVRDAHRLFEVSENYQCKKDWFKNQMKYWLNSKMGWDSEEKSDNVYMSAGQTIRSTVIHVYNKLNMPKSRVFDLEDFIDSDALDDKDKPVGRKITVYSIRDELK